MRSHFPWKLGYAAGAVGLLLALYMGAHYAALLTNPGGEGTPVSQLPAAILEPSRDDSRTIPLPAPNPVGKGIPVSMLTPEILGPSRDDQKTIPLSAFRQTPVKQHLVGPGDTLGIHIEGIVGEKARLAPVSPRDMAIEPDVGSPFVVAADGKLELPLVSPISVDKKTLPEIRDLIRKAYLGGEEPILEKGNERILVSLLQPRKVRVQVIREDANIGVAGGSRRAVGQTLELPVYESDVFSALDRTGGPPHLDAHNEVIVERSVPGVGSKIIRLPMRIGIGEKIPFSQSDIILENGDILFIEARDTEVYYTGGLMQSKQIVLPRDYDLRALQAVADANGPVLDDGLGNSSPGQLSVIRRTKDHGLVTIRVDMDKAFLDPRENIVIQPGDFLVLQETVGETTTR
jgi:hypothetical protein